MNNTAKGIIIFVAGCAAGSAVTYFTLKNRIQKKADEQIAEFRSYYESKTKKYRIADKMNAAAEKMEDEKMSEMYDKISEYGEDYVNYTEYAAKAEKEHPREEIPGPRIISEDEFCDPMPYYAKVTLWYDKDSDRLVDQMSEEEVPVDTIGRDIIDAMVRDDSPTMYVRNDSISIDYEVDMI